MKTAKITLALAIAFTLFAAIGLQAADVKWFDMENCSFCKPMMAKPGLIENIKWETVKLCNGIATLETVAAEKLADYRVVVKEIDEMTKRLQKGEKMELCGFCLAMGALIEKGVHYEYVPTSSGGLTLLTSSDSTMQKEISAFHEKTEEMMKKMEAEQEKEQGEKEEGK